MGFVRWTEQRNFEATLDMMADERLDLRPLVSHRFAIKGSISEKWDGRAAQRIVEVLLRRAIGTGLDANPSTSMG